MNENLDVQFKKNYPKRTWLHKLNIFLPFNWGIVFIMNICSHHIFISILDLICVLCWSFQWYVSAKKYNIEIAKYKDEHEKKVYDFDMKNSFNFGNYHIK